MVKTCIFTIIKNEHLYLEEWIKYHLDIGVLQIFILEDFGSLSHETITSKFKDKVTLLSMDKLLKNKSPLRKQSVYIENALDYIKSLKIYNWCFVMDSDEFITFKSGLDDIAMYNMYDALILSWQNYNANGLIEQPDYSKTTVQETFTKPCDYFKKDTSLNNVKTAYNMFLYNKGYSLSQHLPSRKITWCNTNQIKEIPNKLFDNVYIRHYITKSWQEWSNKLLVRGMFYKSHRKLEDFFEINPELEPEKEYLLSKIKNNQ